MARLNYVHQRGVDDVTGQCACGRVGQIRLILCGGSCVHWKSAADGDRRAAFDRDVAGKLGVSEHESFGDFVA